MTSFRVRLTHGRRDGRTRSAATDRDAGAGGRTGLLSLARLGAEQQNVVGPKRGVSQCKTLRRGAEGLDEW